jgi:hypothetical protein
MKLFLQHKEVRMPKTERDAYRRYVHNDIQPSAEEAETWRAEAEYWAFNS